MYLFRLTGLGELGAQSRDLWVTMPVTYSDRGLPPSKAPGGLGAIPAVLMKTAAAADPLRRESSSIRTHLVPRGLKYLRVFAGPLGIPDGILEESLSEVSILNRL